MPQQNSVQPSVQADGPQSVIWTYAAPGLAAKSHVATTAADPANADPTTKPRLLVLRSSSPDVLLTSQLVNATPLLGPRRRSLGTGTLTSSVIVGRPEPQPSSSVAP